MDLTTAENHVDRLQKELDAMHGHETEFPTARKLLSTEVERLNLEVAEICIAGDSVSEVKIAVENESMMLQLSKDFPSLADFQAELVSELPDISNFDQPLPFTYQLARRVIELLEEEIRRQKKSGSEGSSSSRSGVFNDEMNKLINAAIKTVIEGNKEGANASSNLVLDILSKNKSIKIDDEGRSAVRKRFFEATFPLDRKPLAPAK